MAEQTPPEEKRSVARLVVAAVITVIAVVFIVQNSTSAEVHFLFWTFTLAAWAWILVIFVLGVLAGVLVPRYRARGAKKR